MLGGAFPAKLKAIRILHLNRAIKIALSIAMPLFSAKMRARCVHRAYSGAFSAKKYHVSTELLISTGCLDFVCTVRGANRSNFL